ncbi:hypothetical protein KCU65_g3363, partial [Aureobasidium melanogenum]
MRRFMAVLAILTGFVEAQSATSTEVESDAVLTPSEVFVLPIVYVTAEDAPAATATILASTATASSDPSATQIFDSAEALAIALSSGSTPASTTTLAVAERAATCIPQPPGISHTSLPDSATGFISDPYYYNQSVSASTPSGWVRAFAGLNASNSADRCLGFTLLPSYDVQACANKCASLPSCDSINMYFERDPSTSIDNSTCTDPSEVTNVKCVLWKGAVVTSNANNFGQRRAEFQVVVAGSLGYIKSAFAASLPIDVPDAPDEPSTTVSSALPTATTISANDPQNNKHVSASNKRHSVVDSTNSGSSSGSYGPTRLYKVCVVTEGHKNKYRQKMI